MTRRPPAAPAARFFLPDLCTLPAAVGLVLFGELMAIVLSLARYGIAAWSWVGFGMVSFLVIWIVIVSTMLLCRLRPWLIQRSLTRGMLASYGIILGCTGVFTLAWQLFSIPLAGAGLSEFRRAFDGAVLVENLVISAIITGIILRYFYIQQQLALQRQAELQSRIQALQSRIRPHFLFNSMNIIASLIAIDPKLAERVVEDLATLFRATLADAKHLVPLSEEIALCERYVRIEQLRLGERLQADWQVDPAVRDVPVPHLSLQPLVENAVYHGIQPRVQGGTVTISAQPADGMLCIRVANPYNEEVSNRHAGNRMALGNLQSRLHAFFGERSRFAAGGHDGIFEVMFSVPLGSAQEGQNHGHPDR